MTFAATEKGKQMVKEYIEREALISEFKRLKLGENSFIERVFADGVYAIIEQFPAADVAPVVRCQDCVYARPLKDMNYDYLCHYWNGHSCNQNQFCSQGKRKEDENEKKDTNNK